MDELKKNCVVLVQLEDPLRSLKEIVEYFGLRKIVVENLLLYNGEKDLAKLEVHCMLEKDRMNQLFFFLDHHKKVKQVELMTNHKRQENY